MCRQCEGIIEVNASNDNAFRTSDFSKIALGNVGRGQYNYKRRGTEVSLDELKEMCHDDSPDEVEEPLSPEIGHDSNNFFAAAREPEREPVRRREPEPEPVRRVEPERREEASRSRRSPYTKPNRPFGFIGLALAGASVFAALTFAGSMSGVSLWGEADL